MNKFGYLLAFMLPVLSGVSFYMGGLWYLAPVIFVFGILTVLDQVIGLNTMNIPENMVATVGEEYFYRLLTYCWTFIQMAFVIGCMYWVSLGKVNAWYEWIGFVLSCSLVTGGIGITVAHELGHKKSRLEKLYSKILLMSVCYMHFYIEHNKGHHVHVATPHDPATARKDEHFFKFWVRCVFNSYIHAWQIENESWRRKNQSPINLKNEMIWFTVLPILFCVSLTIFFSRLHHEIIWSIPVFFFSQSVLAFTMLELVNYIEHYGIVRKQQENGRYERVNPLHSWNASHKLSNYFLFQLQRHSDHHFNAIKRYQVLNHFDESPQLPFGYPTMILIALVPPLWFSIMNPLLNDWKGKVYSRLSEAA